MEKKRKRDRESMCFKIDICYVEGCFELSSSLIEYMSHMFIFTARNRGFIIIEIGKKIRSPKVRYLTK